MKKTFYLLLLGMFATIGFNSCEEGSVGSTISQSQIDIVMDSSFTVSGSSVGNEKIQSRTISQLLGAINADDYGILKSDFVTQFMPSLNLDTTGVTVNTIDSVQLILRIAQGNYIGDSIAPMRLSVYRLNKQLPPSPIYSDFNPVDYFSKSDLMGSAAYTASALGLSDSIADLSYREVKVKMPLEFGRKLYTEYKNNPTTFANPETFAKYFPGVYVTTTYGNGRIMNIENTVMTFYYHKNMKTDEDKDTTYYVHTDYLATTPEILTNNNIKLNIASSIGSRIAKGEAIIQAPAGLDVKLKFPTKEIVEKLMKGIGNDLGVVNNLYFEIPVTEIPSLKGITPPAYLLLISETKKDEFFKENSVVDNISSFYATYDSTNKKYIFSDMRDFILDIVNEKGGEVKDEDINLILTPISATFEQNSTTEVSTLVSITPAVTAPSVAKLNLDKAKIRITYSKQSVKF
ncbi:MAG: DUF4270 domain-containing protein [Muribaculaceae bacterium]|nr:DUF4270 domain-containing protein [Muribaculaceae bacterium]